MLFLLQSLCRVLSTETNRANTGVPSVTPGGFPAVCAIFHADVKSGVACNGSRSGPLQGHLPSTMHRRTELWFMSGAENSSRSQNFISEQEAAGSDLRHTLKHNDPTTFPRSTHIAPNLSVQCATWLGCSVGSRIMSQCSERAHGDDSLLPATHT